MADPPGNYDAVTIGFAPGQMHSTAANIIRSATNISNDLGGIMNALSNLRLSWTGSSADKANEFNTRWVNAMTALYGTKGDPGSGIVNQIASGLEMAGQNYQNTEDGVTSLFNAFAGSGGGGGSSSGGGSAADHVTNGVYHTTSVNEAAPEVYKTV